MRLFSSKICHGEVVRQAAVLITTAAAIASTFCTSTLATVVEVPANMSTPTSSGVILQVGELLNVEATGSASYGFEGTCDCFPTTFPDGSRFNGTIDLGPKPDPFAVLPSAPIGALIGEIGVSGPWFFVGESYSAPADRSGEFFLLYNDAVGTYSNNFGSYFATVSTTAVSEPTSLMLLGVGLLGIAMLFRCPLSTQMSRSPTVLRTAGMGQDRAVPVAEAEQPMSVTKAVGDCR